MTHTEPVHICVSFYNKFTQVVFLLCLLVSGHLCTFSSSDEGDRSTRTGGCCTLSAEPSSAGRALRQSRTWKQQHSSLDPVQKWTCSQVTIPLAFSNVCRPRNPALRALSCYLEKVSSTSATECCPRVVYWCFSLRRSGFLHRLSVSVSFGRTVYVRHGHLLRWVLVL